VGAAQHVSCTWPQPAEETKTQDFPIYPLDFTYLPIYLPTYLETDGITDRPVRIAYGGEVGSEILLENSGLA
jgi:hypothetical protein